MNIIELIEGQLDDRFTTAAARETGLTADAAKTTARAAIPALLAAILGSVTKPSGAKALGSILKDQNLLGNVSSMFDGSGAQSLVSTGVNALSSLLGEGKLSSLAGAIGGAGGISQQQSRSLIGMLFPLVMGVLSRQQRGSGKPSVDGISRMLNGQKQEIANAMPASVASSLRSAGLLDGLEEAPARRTSASATAASTPHYATSAHRPAERKRNWLWPIAAGAGALAVLVWAFNQFGGDQPDRRAAADSDRTQLAVATPSDTDLRVGNVDLRQELTGVVNQASQSLRGVTDAASAEDALPTLSRLNDDLDDMTPLVDRLPKPAQDAFSRFARQGYGRLETDIDRIQSIPGIPDRVTQVVREMSSKFEAFST